MKPNIIIRRDGTEAPFDQTKITRAISLCFADVDGLDVSVADKAPDFTLTPERFAQAQELSEQVMMELIKDGEVPTVERTQDQVERVLFSNRLIDEGRAYARFRQNRTQIRIQEAGENGMQEYIGLAKYSRFFEEKGRRENYTEAVQRVRDMHLEQFAGKGSEPEIQAAFAAVASKEVLPSMRSMQFGGKAILSNHTRMYNCAATPINRPRAFQELFYTLLCGTGEGFSVQKHDIAQLPPLAPANLTPQTVKKVIIPDTIEGWSESLGHLIHSKMKGYKVEFDYSQIRPKGTHLKTSGGKAPGPEPLQKALEKIETILDVARGRKLKPIEAYDVCMFAAGAVLSGGIRRSATICLFSPDDEEMMKAKTGNWFDNNLQRKASNNSAVISRQTTTMSEFRKLFEAQKAFGEPGFYFSSNPKYLCNPCVEIGLNPIYQIVDEKDIARLQKNTKEWMAQMEKKHGSDLAGVDPYTAELFRDLKVRVIDNTPKIGDEFVGQQFCNLSTINGAAVKTEKEFFQACKNAAVIGTLQAAYTQFAYLGPVTQSITEREALIGVSICGVMDSPRILLNPQVLSAGAEIVKETNAELAEKLGIERAARTTAIKPEGTTSLLLKCASGIHPHHAEHYLRRVQANRLEPLYQCFKERNPSMCEPSVYNPEGDDVICFPVSIPEGALTKDDFGAVTFLSMVREVQGSWVESGRATEKFSPGLHNNVSNTVTVKNEEWENVATTIWNNREHFTGISLLSHTGDQIYPQAPLEAITGEKGLAAWERLKFKPVEYSTAIEDAGNVSHQAESACAGGACEIVRT